MSARDYNAEYRDSDRRYAYQFDTILRGYIMRALDPYLPPGAALEMGCFDGGIDRIDRSALQRPDGGRGVERARRKGERPAGTARTLHHWHF